MWVEVDIDFHHHCVTLGSSFHTVQGAMIVCHCHRVCDRTIRAAVKAGADTEEAVAHACGAGTGCGRCRPALSALIDSESRPVRSLPMLTNAANAA